MINLQFRNTIYKRIAEISLCVRGKRFWWRSSGIVNIQYCFEPFPTFLSFIKYISLYSSFDEVISFSPKYTLLFPQQSPWTISSHRYSSITVNVCWTFQILSGTLETNIFLFSFKSRSFRVWTDGYSLPEVKSVPILQPEDATISGSVCEGILASITAVLYTTLSSLFRRAVVSYRSSRLLHSFHDGCDFLFLPIFIWWDSGCVSQARIVALNS